ncbi:hypothetical protein SYNTR_0179 [Candidatus Syntrophocurvum alkaliphilum]|uniref:Uncharacterized protein n=1 Tax=Candidatus Syntrophocurvum alkaliphilum TaxID=2293317 RepID=A0A6I6DD52_9FIRM|nr:hypothetical protein [Candidatus Syntrophocurvum alkaliphilum]QGT98772.1 hypothetical protein SYNTR_0179 [Candidatus Syntrophocurvum alkaliphilum]
MQKLGWLFWLSVFLILLSIFFFSLNYIIFKDLEFIYSFILVELGFLSISVLLFTIVLERLLTYIANKEKTLKLNTLIGVFFSDIGTDLLRHFTKFDLNSEELEKNFV